MSADSYEIHANCSRPLISRASGNPAHGPGSRRRAIAYGVSVPQMRDPTDTTAVALVVPLVGAGFKPTLFRQSRLARYSRDHWSSAQDLRKGGFKTRPYKHPEP